MLLLFGNHSHRFAKCRNYFESVILMIHGVRYGISPFKSLIPRFCWSFTHFHKMCWSFSVGHNSYRTGMYFLSGFNSFRSIFSIFCHFEACECTQNFPHVRQKEIKTVHKIRSLPSSSSCPDPIAAASVLCSCRSQR